MSGCGGQRPSSAMRGEDGSAYVTVGSHGIELPPGRGERQRKKERKGKRGRARQRESQ